MTNVKSLSLGIASLMSLSAFSAPEAAPFLFTPTPASGGPRNYHRLIRRSRYMPHQGKRECARRLRQVGGRSNG